MNSATKFDEQMWKRAAELADALDEVVCYHDEAHCAAARAGDEVLAAQHRTDSYLNARTRDAFTRFALRPTETLLNLAFVRAALLQLPAAERFQATLADR